MDGEKCSRRTARTPRGQFCPAGKPTKRLKNEEFGLRVSS